MQTRAENLHICYILFYNLVYIILFYNSEAPFYTYGNTFFSLEYFDPAVCPQQSDSTVLTVYLAVVLSFVLQHLLQVEAAGQVALCQVVTELRNAEQMLLHTYSFTVNRKKCAHTHKNKERVEGGKDSCK